MNDQCNHTQLLDDIGKIVQTRGIKAATMDSIAASLSISKRTLYEIFENKQDMIVQVIEHIHKSHEKEIVKIIEASTNLMEGALKVCENHIKIMNSVSVEFVRDLQEFHCPPAAQTMLPEKRIIDQTAVFLRQGAKQGVFRDNLNFEVCVKMMFLQMESMKRMEEIFSSDVSINDVFSNIVIMFLRGIASHKGLEILDTLLKTSSLSLPKREDA